MLISENFENLSVNVLNVNQSFAVMPLIMDYLIMEPTKLFYFLRLWVKI